MMRDVCVSDVRMSVCETWVWVLVRNVYERHGIGR